MTTLALSLAVVSLLLSLVSIFAFSVLRQEQRRLDKAVFSLRPTANIGQFASAGMTLVLAVEPGCISCATRIEDLRSAALPRSPDLPRVVVLSSQQVDKGPMPEWVDVMVDPPLLQQLHINVFPTVIVYNPDGQELTRTIAGNSESFESIQLWANQQQSTLTPAMEKLS